MTDVIDRFKTEYQDFHRISTRRAREQVAILRELEELGGGDVFNDPADLLSRFQVRRLERGNDPATIGRMRGMIRPFYTWAYEKRLITGEALMEVREVRGPRGCTPKYVPRPYKRDEIKLLWRDFEQQYRIPYTPAEAESYMLRYRRGTSPYRRVKPMVERAQVRAIIGLALCGGLRRNEIYGITLNGLHYDNAYLVVRGAPKNRDALPRERIVPWVTPEMREWVREWIDLRTILNPDHDFPWLSLWGMKSWWLPLHPNRYEALMRRLGRGWEFHRLRHTAATEMLRGGYPLESVQRILGHATITQTLAYAQLLPDDLVRVAAKSQLAMSAALTPEAA